MIIRWHRNYGLLLGLVVWHSLDLCAQATPELPRHHEESIFGTSTPLTGAFHGKVYRLPEDTRKLPDFESLKSAGDLYTYTLQINPQIYSGEFRSPMKRDAWFGIDYSGKFWVEHAGTFDFFLRSDDGARLYLDEVVVIDNDGVHPGSQIKAGQLRIAHGLHRIRVAYFQGPPTSVALQLAVRPRGGEFQVFDMRKFSAPDGMQSPSLKSRPQ